METKTRRRKAGIETPFIASQTELGDRWSESMDRSRELIVNGVRNLQEQTLRLIDQRLERDAEAIRDYRRCRTIADILSVQQKWLSGVGLDLFEGGMRMGQLMQEMVSEEASEFGKTAETSLRESMEDERDAA